MRRVLIAALALAGCAVTPPASAPSAPIAGVDWVVDQVAGQTDLGGRPPTLRIEEDRASGFAGCNRWFSTVTQDGAALSFSATGATRMLCQPDAMRIERAFLDQIRVAASARREGDALIVFDAAGAEILRLSLAYTP